MTYLCREVISTTRTTAVEESSDKRNEREAEVEKHEQYIHQTDPTNSLLVRDLRVGAVGALTQGQTEVNKRVNPGLSSKKVNPE